MAQFSGKYMRVWKTEVRNGYTKVDLGDSKKNRDGTYDSWTWFGCTLFGDAGNVEVQEGDLVEVKSGRISKRKWDNKYYDDIVIFDLEVMKKAEKKEEETEEKEEVKFDNFQSVDDEDCPF